MTTYLEVVVNVPHVHGVFTYHVPETLEGQVKPGQLVEAPFGSRAVQGVVLALVDHPAEIETRPITALIDPEALVTPAQIALAQQMAEDTLTSLADCISLMLPPGLGQQVDMLYTLKTISGALTPTQQRLVDLLRTRGSLRGRQINQAMAKVDWRASVRSLLRKGMLAAQSVLPPPTIHPKRVRTVKLACAREVAEAALPGLGKAGSPALQRRQAALRFLLRETGAVEIAWVYAESGAQLADLYYLEERGLVAFAEAEVWRDPLAGLEFIPSEPLPLTSEQQNAWEHIQAGMQAAAQGKPPPPFLLHGVTGSGKTEIYMCAVAEALRAGRQALVLVPEIGMTPQTVHRFAARFPGQVGLVHSRLSPGERYDTWRRARQGDLAVIVGPRSALFTPFARPGVIIVDEFHDDSYYQAEIPPYYHARQLAVMYAHLAGAVCVLGSATPDVESRYRAAVGEWQYLGLPARILAHKQTVQNQLQKLAAERQEGAVASHYRPLEADAETIELPSVRIIDMREELKAGNRSIFSRALQQALTEVLQHREQAILFLNRRGSATYVFCRDCGYALKCPRCEIPLTLHTDAAQREMQTEALICHRCGYRRKMVQSCPQCKGTRVRHFGVGTERVEEEIRSLYPQARPLRWDFETTREKGAHDLILNRFSSHQADILVGTQMVAKGLDLPLVTLVGVVLAEVGLNLPDLRAAERTFQVLTQVAGRAGRSPLGGQVILQTFQPEQYAIQAAAGHDYDSFYRQELQARRSMGYPPFARLVRLEYRHLRAEQAEAVAHKLAAQLQAWIEEERSGATEIIGPAPCFYARLGGQYRWQIVLRGPDPAALLRGRIPEGWRIETNPPSLL